MGSPEQGDKSSSEGDDWSGGRSSGKSPATDSSTKPGPSVSYSLFECSECSTVVLAVENEATSLSCHGQPMEPIEEQGIDHTEPDLKDLLTDVYAMPKMTMDVCHFVFESETASVSEVADHFDYDRSTVGRYLQNLADVGFLTKHTLNREDGGIVHVYRAKPIDETRRAEMVSFLRWAGKAAMVLDEANEIKAECALSEGSLDQIFWDVYQEQRTL